MVLFQENETTSESGSATENVSTLVNQCVDLCKKDNISNPVTILQILQEKLVIGRPLEINEKTEATGINGETNFILVDRNSIVETAFSEIKDITDLRKCLEVQFYGEVGKLASSILHRDENYLPGNRVIKLFFMLNSTEHEIYPGHKN